MKYIVLLTVAILCGSCATSHRFVIDGATARNVPIRSGRVSGSGVVIGKDSVLTVAHVLQGLEITVHMIRAKVIHRDTVLDLMLLSVPTIDLPPLEINTKLKRGEWVVAVGNPSNITDFVSIGYVNYTEDSGLLASNPTYPGMSGSGLYDESGRLVGINTSVAGLGPQGMTQTLSVFASAKAIRKFLWEAKRPP